MENAGNITSAVGADAIVVTCASHLARLHVIRICMGGHTSANLSVSSRLIFANLLDRKLADSNTYATTGCGLGECKSTSSGFGPIP